MQIVGLVSFPCGRLAPSALCTSEAAGHIGGGGTTCQSGEARDGRRMAVGGGMEKRTLALATAIFAPTQLQSTPKDTSAKEPASMNCRVRAMQTSCSERAVTSRVAGHRAAPQRLPRPAAGDHAFSSSKFRQSSFVWCSAWEAIQLPPHHTRRLDRGFEVWVMMCAPEERLDAAPTGHGVGVEDAESDREDCERRQGVGTGGPTADTRDTLRPQSMRPQDRRIRGRSCAVLEAHNCPRSSMGWTGWFRRESTGKSHCKTVTQAVTTHTNMTRNRVTGKHRVG